MILTTSKPLGVGITSEAFLTSGLRRTGSQFMVGGGLLTDAGYEVSRSSPHSSRYMTFPTPHLTWAFTLAEISKHLLKGT